MNYFLKFLYYLQYNSYGHNIHFCYITFSNPDNQQDNKSSLDFLMFIDLCDVDTSSMGVSSNQHDITEHGISKGCVVILYGLSTLWIQ